jgi:hypothetical protein
MSSSSSRLVECPACDDSRDEVRPRRMGGYWIKIRTAPCRVTPTVLAPVVRLPRYKFDRGKFK